MGADQTLGNLSLTICLRKTIVYRMTTAKPQPIAVGTFIYDPTQPCANCAEDIRDHNVAEAQNCQREHLASFRPTTWATPGGYGDLPMGD